MTQHQTFERVGGNDSVRTDVRLIAATHRDLKVWSAEGKFRADLYYRLNVFNIHLPPLRDRGEDLLLLIQFFLRRFSRELGRDVREIAPDALERMRGYSWPGNVRELQSVLKQSILQAIGGVLLSAFLPDDLVSGPSSRATNGAGKAKQTSSGQTLADMERAAIQSCLLETGGNRQRTAELLGISTRTLLRKIRTYRLDDPRRSQSPGEKGAASWVSAPNRGLTTMSNAPSENPPKRVSALDLIPHTQVHTVVRRILENLQDIVIAILMILLLILSLQSLWRLGKMAVVDSASTVDLLSEIVFILILTEVYRLLIFYLREHRISVVLMIEVALVSTLREIMLRGAHEFEWPRLFGLSILLAVLGALLAVERWTRLRRCDPSETDAR